MAYFKRTIRLIVGLLLFALGSYLSIQANIGLAPWEAFGMGCAYLTGASYGNVVVVTGLLILVVDCLLKEKIGLGTVLNVLLIGKFIDLFGLLHLVPMMHNFFAGLAVLLLGQVVICIGSYFYIGAGMGCGPRDALMVALGKRLPKVPLGAIRGMIEGAVLLLGWLLGAKVGVGTLIAVFGIGFILEYTFKCFHFDAKAVSHENLVQTARGMRTKH
ncbi:MAG: hypothetical protein RR296_00485 [Clostridia bacterium]